MPKNHEWVAVESNTTHTNVNEIPTHKANYLTEHEEIPNSPLTITKTEEGYFIRAGSYRLTDITQTREDALETLKTHQWEIICSLIGIIVDGTIEAKINKK